jgi:hypothetical protein
LAGLGGFSLAAFSMVSLALSVSLAARISATWELSPPASKLVTETPARSPSHGSMSSS